MLSRRNMVKALLSMFVGLAGGAAAWQAWWRRRGLNEAAGSGQPVVSEPTRSEPAKSEPVKSGPAQADSTKPVLSFFLLSDIHMTTDNGALAAKLHMALKDISNFESPVETLVLGGDLVDGGREGDYQLLQEIFAGYKLPERYGNMGNHEYYDVWYNAKGDWSTATSPNGKTDGQARERFMRFMGYKDRAYHDVWVNGVHLLMLSQEAYIQERPEVGEGAWYSDQQLTWLAERMKPHADGRPAFIFIHQPLPPTGEDGGQHRLVRAKEFRRILAPYRNLFVLSGHTHWNLELDGHYVRDTTFQWFTNASVGKTRGAGSIAAPVQGMYVQVYPDRVVVRGREFSNRTWIKAADWRIPLA